MKNIYSLLLSCLVSAFISNAQTFSYKSGQTFKSSKFEEIELLAIGENHILYMAESKEESTLKREVMKLNKSSLEIVETLDLLKEKVTGQIAYKMVLGNELYLFIRTPEKRGSKIVSYTLEALRINTEKNLSDYTNTPLGDYDQTATPYVNYLPNEQLFQIRSGIEVKHYNREIKPVDQGEKKITGGGGLELRMKGIDVLDLFGTNQANGTYFYPLFGGTDIFVESVYTSQSNSLGKGKKVYSSIELSHYLTNTESKTKIYSVSVKPDLMIIDYDCHLLKDTSVIVFGIYQEKAIRSGKINIGVFSARVDKNLNEITATKYLHLIDAKPDALRGHPMAKYLFGYSGRNLSFKPMDQGNPDQIVILSENESAINSYEYICMKVDRKTGEIRNELLWNMCSGSLVWEDFTGFYHLVLSNDLSVIFFNDHKKNTGLTANPPKLELCEMNVKTTAFSYVTYSTDSGFGNRTALIQSAVEKFLLDIEMDDIALLGKNDSGEFEFILAAYDKDKEIGKLYKIAVKL